MKKFNLSIIKYMLAMMIAIGLPMQTYALTWNTPAGVTRGGMESILINPYDATNIFVATDFDSVFKSNDASASGVTTTIGLTGVAAINSLVVAPVTPSIIYVATNTDVFQSVDTGLHWRSFGALTGNVNDLVIDTSGGGLYATGEGQVSSTAINKPTWTTVAIPSRLNIPSITIDSKARSTFATQPFNQMKSAINGAAWSQIIAVTDSDIEVDRNATFKATNQGVLISRGGLNWAEVVVISSLLMCLICITSLSHLRFNRIIS